MDSQEHSWSHVWVKKKCVVGRGSVQGSDGDRSMFGGASKRTSKYEGGVFNEWGLKNGSGVEKKTGRICYRIFVALLNLQNVPNSSIFIEENTYIHTIVNPRTLTGISDLKCVLFHMDGVLASGSCRIATSRPQSKPNGKLKYIENSECGWNYVFFGSWERRTAFCVDRCNPGICVFDDDYLLTNPHEMINPCAIFKQ